MRLRNVGSLAIRAVTPPRPAVLYLSLGTSTTLPGGKRVPAYEAVTGLLIDVQALSGPDIEHLSGQNIQGVTRAAYLDGNVQGVDRVSQKGGDLLQFDGAWWLVKVVFETWDSNGWCKVGLVKQTEGPET